MMESASSTGQHGSQESSAQQQKQKRKAKEQLGVRSGPNSAKSAVESSSQEGKQNKSHGSSGQPPGRAQKKQKQELTLNPNRQKPRITRACDQCRSNHYRCTGAKPCLHCVKGQRRCTYDGKYTRGKAPPFWEASEKDQADLLKKQGWLTPGTDPRTAAKSLSKGVMEGAQEQDVQNKQVFPAHGSLFDRTRNSQGILHQEKASIFRSGDAPFPDIDTSFVALPPAAEARQMVAIFFEAVAATVHFVHIPTVNSWLHEILEEQKGNQVGPIEPGKRAVVFMVLALTNSQQRIDSSEGNSDLSFGYFLAAEKHLDAETGEIHLPTIQARLLQCLFLLSKSRIHQCWSIFGTIVNLVIATGLHRKNGIPGNIGAEEEDMILCECRKRVFWVAYVLDKYLGAVTGRPQLFSDEDIDQELPALADDDKLTATSMTVINHNASMKATVCQIRLSMIIGHILKRLYSIRPITPHKRHDRTAAIEKEFEQWREEAATFVEFDDDSFLDALSVVQSRALKLAYANAEILLYRTFLSDNIEDYKAKHGFGVDFREQTLAKVEKCLDAALRTTDMIDELFKTAENFDDLWFVHFCGYSAVVALYVFIIRYTKTNKAKKYLKIAEKCQKQIEFSEEVGSFAKRCSTVLEELRIEAVAKLDGSRNGGMGSASGSGSSILDKIKRWGFSSLVGY